MGNIWQVWKYALGSFSDDKTSKYDDVIAIVRTCILFAYLITNFFIISGVIRHWNNGNDTKLAAPQQEAAQIQKETSDVTSCKEED